MMDDYFLNSIVETDFCKAKLSLTTNEYSWKIIYQHLSGTYEDKIGHRPRMQSRTKNIASCFIRFIFSVCVGGIGQPVY